MEISRKSWERYISGLRKINDKAAEMIINYLGANGFPATRDEMNALIDYAFSVSSTLGEAAATMAAEMYDAIAIASGARVPSAIPADVADIGEVAKNIIGTIQTGNPEITAGAVYRLVKRAAADTTLNNAIRDFAQCAWIPHGDTCSFCIMLASNGWRRASKKTLKGGHAEHIHPNCDCTFAIRFDPFTEIEGYEPEKYLQMYEDSDGNKWQDKLNSMRREQYQKNKDEINERKRINYAERKERAE